MRIGIAGTGRMGTAIAKRLLMLKHEVRVWNRTPENARDARASGAGWSPTLRQLVNESEVVISFLFDDAAVQGAYLGADGLLTGQVEGCLFIDMSTVSPAAHKSIAPELTLRAAAFIECPVSGSVQAARSGALVGFVGGSAPDFTRAQPLLEQICRRVEHVGPLGAGARMKLAANLLLATFMQAVGESLLLVDATAGGAAQAVDVLADSNIGAAILRARASRILAALSGDTSGAVEFDLDTLRKDLVYMSQEAATHGQSLPLASRTLECFDSASREGRGGMDIATYPAYWIHLQKAAANGQPPAAPEAL